MGLFTKNPNETAYTGGQKHFADVIKNNDRSGEALIWRAPEEDFNVNSTLIVMPGEEAVFIKGGVVEQVFDNHGSPYKLSTENYPFISRLRNAFTGGVSAFNCVVYFVRKADSKEIGWGWGENSPLRIEDPKFGQDVNLIATGSFKIMIDNPTVLLNRMAGNVDGVTKDDFFAEYARAIIIQNVKTSIKQAISSDNAGRDIVDIIGNLGELQSRIEPIIEEKICSEYGIKLRYFVFDKVTPAEDDPGYNEIMSQKRDDARMRRYGVDYRTHKALDMMDNISTNQGSGGVAAAGAGLGMGMAAGGAFGGLAQQVFAPVQQPAQQQPAQQQPAAAPAQKPEENPVEKIKQLKEMFDLGIISQDEFDAKKQEILNRM